MAWGDNRGGQLGTQAPVDTKQFTPALVGKGFTNIAAGYKHTLALKADESLWSWGSDGFGALGNDRLETSALLTPKQIGTGYVAVAAGDYTSVALKKDGTVWSWGFNSYGSVGDGTLTHREAPVQVLSLGAAPAAPTDAAVDCLLDWAQSKYASMLGNASGSQSRDSFRFRYYPLVNGYLAVSGNEKKLYAYVQDQVLDLGDVSAWLSQTVCTGF